MVYKALMIMAMVHRIKAMRVLLPIFSLNTNLDSRNVTILSSAEESTEYCTSGSDCMTLEDNNWEGLPDRQASAMHANALQ